MNEKQKILIVDDSEMNRDLLVDILEDQYDVIEAENGVRAIEILTEQRDTIAVVLLDIMMPGIDGFGVLKHIAQNKWNDSFAVIMISADDSPENINRAYEMGAFDYINRPFDATIVQKRVSNTMCLFARQKHLEQLVVEQFEENERTNHMMIAILSHIVEFRNGESGAHVMHVNRITEIILNQLVLHTSKYNLSQADIALITMASSLHDIGKIAIPEEILNKPGRLTDEEFELMKRHAAIGSNILLCLPVNQQSTPLVKVAFEICRWHHERFDGKGYPDGLKGDEIPIAAQVVAVADVYDALTSERCYKKALSHEEAVQMILDGKCGSFNPLILQCLTEVRNELVVDIDEDSADQYPVHRPYRKIDYESLFSGKRYNYESQQQKIQDKLYTDSLTETYNRRYYDEFIREADDLRAAVMIDIDNFKSINDTYGHDVGDMVLRIVSKALLSCVRKSDAVVRYGGDEFVIIFYQIPRDVFTSKLERMRALIEGLSLEGYPSVRISISVGGAYGRKKVRELIKIADNMMYRSKLTKNQVNIQFVDEEVENI